MRSVCRDDAMPVMETIWRWIREKPDFREQYAQATEERTEAHNELLLELGDEALKEAHGADPKASGAVVQAVKLKADNLKWVMSKMKPKKYGDKIDHTTAGKELPQPILNVILPNNSNKQGDGDEEADTSDTGGDIRI